MWITTNGSPEQTIIFITAIESEAVKMYVLALISLIWIAYKLGKEDGKWGLFAVLAVLFVIAFIMTLFNR